MTFVQLLKFYKKTTIWLLTFYLVCAIIILDPGVCIPVKRYAWAVKYMNFKRENGFSLIEVIVGVAIVAIVGLVIMIGTTTTTKAQITHRDEITGEILARSQMEYVMRQPYSSSPWSYSVTSSQRSSGQQPLWWDSGNPPLLSDIYAGYLVSVNATDYDADRDGVLEIPGDDSDICNIVVKVYHPVTKLLVTVESYKVNR
jgi:prepilin-type N-terminal cleavage/methylation domain-containing protein